MVYHACGDRRLPTTLSQLYHDFILQAIRRHVACNTTYDVAPDQIGNLDCIPQSIENISTSFKEMCRFAYQSLNNKDNPKMTFSVPELDQHLPHLDQVNYLGLMTTFTLGGERNYQFLHLSIQEFLAAWWIAKFDHENTDKIFALQFNNDHFRLCLRFVAGLTHLEDKNYQHYFEKELNLYGKKRPFFKLHANYYSWFNQSEFMIGYDNNFMTDDLDLFLLQILYESQNIRLCQVLSKSIKDSQLSLRIMKPELSSLWTMKRELSLFDMLCFSYFLKNSNKTWNYLDLWRLNEQSVQLFIDTLANNLQQNCCNIKLKVNLTCPSVKFLQLSFFRNLEELSVDLEDSNNFVTCFVELTKLPHLKILHLFSGASKVECEENLFHVLENNLEINSTLEDVAIRSESLPCIKSVINGLAGNRTVKSLSLAIWSYLNKGQLPENTIEHLLDANHTLEALSLDIHDHFVSPLKIINVNTPLTTLKIGGQSAQLSVIPYHARNLRCLVVNLLCPPSYIFPFHPKLQQLDLQLNTADSINKLFSILQTNTTLTALRVQIYDFYEFESIGASLQCMLACNRTMKCLKIELKMIDRVKVPCRFLPTIYLSILTDGLLQNNFLQQLSIEIPLSDTNRDQIRYLFFIMSQKYHLTELDVTFKLDESYLERYSYHETKGELRWSLLYKQALPLIIYLLDSHTNIRLFKFHFTLFNYDTIKYKAEWLLPIYPFQPFIDAIFDHPSLEYISFPYEILPYFYIDKCRQCQRQKSSPMIDMYRGYVQRLHILKFLAFEDYQ